MSSPRGATLILAGVLLFAGLQLILLRYLFNLDDVILNNFISDSAIYQQMVDAFRGVAAPVTRSPFGSRILTPLLASILPAGSSEALFIVNLASGLLTLSLLHSFGVAHVGLTRRNASLAALAHATSIPYLTYGCLDLIDLTTYLFVILFLRVGADCPSPAPART